MDADAEALSVKHTERDWALLFQFDWIEDRLEPVGLTISPVAGRKRRPLTTTAVRRLNVASLIGRARGALLRAGVGMAEIDDEAAREELERRLTKSGLTRLGADHWIRVAAVYAEARRKGEAPTRAVERAFGVSYGRAAKYVSRARELGLLTRAGKGKASGTVHLAAAGPTPRKHARLSADATVTKAKKPSSSRSRKGDSRGTQR
ncbi:MAG TPA: hypothetical protein VFA08_01310 [Actinomycetota bacterium]|nr:hypothetical protein [Actinomycetota bacterium]